MTRNTTQAAIKAALANAGWDNVNVWKLAIGNAQLAVDLDSTFLVADTATESIAEYIAVEVPDFEETTESALYQGIGQYLVRRTLLCHADPKRTLYLGISDRSATMLFQGADMKAIVKDCGIRLLVVNINTKTISKWL